MDFSRLQKVYQKFWWKKVDVKPGQFLEIHEEVGEEDNKRIWKFKGLVIKVWKPSHPDGTFTVRGISSGISVEKIYPFSFAGFSKVLLMDEFKVRRAKLYYLRDKVGKGARMKSILEAWMRGTDLLKADAPVVEEVVVDTVVEEVATPVDAVADVTVEKAAE